MYLRTSLIHNAHGEDTDQVARIRDKSSLDARDCAVTATPCAWQRQIRLHECLFHATEIQLCSLMGVGIHEYRLT